MAELSQGSTTWPLVFLSSLRNGTRRRTSSRRLLFELVLTSLLGGSALLVIRTKCLSVCELVAGKLALTAQVVECWSDSTIWPHFGLDLRTNGRSVMTSRRPMSPCSAAGRSSGCARKDIAGRAPWPVVRLVSPRRSVRTVGTAVAQSSRRCSGSRCATITASLTC